MVSPEVRDAINQQIKHEFYAAYLYLGMMTYFESKSLSGFGHWMRLQAQEEVAHAMRLVDFLIDRGGDVELGPIDAPQLDFETPLEVMKAALGHEQKVTASINDLYALAVEQNDYPAQVLMQWFVSEQVEEEKNAGEIVDQLELAGGSASALLVIDGRLADRVPEDEEEGSA
ncbi:MAG: ferritin [Gemmatimonadetes bacterium]|nr:ferritin [Gemmatimonadota bacterium]